MKILAALFATGLVAMPLSAQEPGAPAQGAAEKPAATPAPAGDAATAGADKPATAPEPETAAPGATPDKPAADPAPNPSR